MENKIEHLEKQRAQLSEELDRIGPFRRGSINTVFRKCGKEKCVCNKKGHPGHGPATTLTYKHQGKSKILNLPSPAAASLVQKQVHEHDRFLQWSKKWLELNETNCDLQLEQLLSSERDEQVIPPQKKRRKKSSKRSSAKSKR